MLTFNYTTASRPERRTRDGREYLVCPVTMLIGDRVLNGSQGRLFYPRDEVVKNVGAWNGVPVTYRHPSDAHGRSVSARDAQPGFRIGVVHGDAVRNGRRVAQAWFDVERLRERDPKLLRRLERGEPVELSTGLFTDNIRSHAGLGYDYVARNYRPDHLAILPDQTGACSVRDGCGVGVANARSAFRRTFDSLLNRSPRRTAMRCDDTLDIPTLKFGATDTDSRGLTNDHLKFAEEGRTPTTNCRRSRWAVVDADDILDIPILNFAEIAAERRTKAAVGLSAPVADDDLLDCPTLRFTADGPVLG